MKKIMKTMALCAAFALIFGLDSCANQTGGSDANTPAETPDAPSTPVYPANGNLTKPDGDNLADVVADLDLSGTWKLVYGYLYAYYELYYHSEKYNDKIELTTPDEIAKYIEKDRRWDEFDDAPKFDADCCVTLSQKYAEQYFGYITNYSKESWEDYLDAYKDEIDYDIQESWCIISKDRKTITVRMNATIREYDADDYADSKINAAIIYEKQS
ncbi:MAG: hypothetical protein J1E07_08925 [Treponema sp.]|nr:hypothetical protein [Treponema sp.]